MSEVSESSLLHEAHRMTYVAIACLVLSWISVALRVYVRGYMIRSFGWDDWLMLAALAFTTTYMMIEVIIASNVLHYTSLLAEITLQVQYTFLELALYITSSIFLKLALAMFLLRVVMEPWQRWIVICAVTIYTLYATGYLFACVMQCGSPSHILMSRLAGKCLKWDIMGPLHYLHAALSAGIDWMFAILPIFVLRKSKMPRKTKISACFVLGLGALGSVASLVRVAYIGGLNWDGREFYKLAIDVTLATTIEGGLGIVAGSLATLRPLLKVILEKARMTGASSNSDTVEDGSAGSRAPMIEAKPPHPKPRNEFALYGYSEEIGQIEALVIERDLNDGALSSALPKETKDTSKIDVAVVASKELSTNAVHESSSQRNIGIS